MSQLYQNHDKAAWDAEMARIMHNFKIVQNGQVIAPGPGIGSDVVEAWICVSNSDGSIEASNRQSREGLVSDVANLVQELPLVGVPKAEIHTFFINVGAVEDVAAFATDAHASQDRIGQRFISALPSADGVALEGIVALAKNFSSLIALLKMMTKPGARILSLQRQHAHQDLHRVFLPVPTLITALEATTGHFDSIMHQSRVSDSMSAAFRFGPVTVSPGQTHQEAYAQAGVEMRAKVRRIAVESQAATNRLDEASRQGLQRIHNAQDAGDTSLYLALLSSRDLVSYYLSGYDLARSISRVQPDDLKMHTDVLSAPTDPRTLPPMIEHVLLVILCRLMGRPFL